MKPTRRFAVSILLACALFAAERRASAIGQCSCPADSDPVLVPEDPYSVSLNFRPLLDLARLDPSSISLATASGEAVPFSLDFSGGHALHWLTPSASLAPSTEYVLVASTVGTSDVQTYSWPFETGASEDHTPPALGAVDLVDGGERAGLCGATVGSSLSISSIADEGVGGGLLMAQVDIDTPDGLVSVFLPFQAFTQQQYAPFGRSLDATAKDCFGYRAFDGAEDGASFPATVTVWDWAGNGATVRDLVLWTTTVRPTSSGTAPGTSDGCSASGERRSPSSVLVLLVVVGIALVWRARSG